MTTYLIHHYTDEHPCKATEERIITLAQDEEYSGDDIEGAMEWLNDGGNLTVWVDEEVINKDYYIEDNVPDSEIEPKYLEDYI